MKILVVNAYKKKGGAARASHRLYEALIDNGVDATYLSAYKETERLIDRTVRSIRVAWDRLPAMLLGGRTIYFSSGGPTNKKLIESINDSGADVVHIHWVNAGAISISDIERIRIPIVWSLHDMWLFTGGCHYDKECRKYESGCGACPLLKSKNMSDISRRNFLSKEKVLSASKVTVVGLSKWIASEAASSRMFSKKSIVNLPNTINIHDFYPEKKEHARAKLGLSSRTEKKTVLFGAMSGSDDPRKGYNELSEALQQLSNVELITFGGDFAESRLDIQSIGKVKSDVMLRNLYSAADVVVVPSLQENLSNVIMESLSCGTPVVAFDIGGNSDMIIHKYNGYLARAFSSEKLSEGINWILFEANTDYIKKNAREAVVSKFSYEKVAPRYLELYRDVVETESPDGKD